MTAQTLARPREFVAERALDDAGVCQPALLGSRTNEDASALRTNQGSRQVPLHNLHPYSGRNPRGRSGCPEVISHMPGSTEP